MNSNILCQISIGKCTTKLINFKASSAIDHWPKKHFKFVTRLGLKVKKPCLKDCAVWGALPGFLPPELTLRMSSPTPQVINYKHPRSLILDLKISFIVTQDILVV